MRATEVSLPQRRQRETEENAAGFKSEEAIACDVWYAICQIEHPVNHALRKLRRTLFECKS
jgi:hypothetical protein